MKLNKQQKRRIGIDAGLMAVFLIGLLAVFTPTSIEFRLLGAFLMAHGLTRFGYEWTIIELKEEITELKNKDSENQNMSN